MSQQATGLLLELSNKVVRDIPHERVFFTAWSLLLVSVWVWSLTSWSSMTSEQLVDTSPPAMFPSIAQGEKPDVHPQSQPDTVSLPRLLLCTSQSGDAIRASLKNAYTTAGRIVPADAFGEVRTIAGIDVV